MSISNLIAKLLTSQDSALYRGWRCIEVCLRMKGFANTAGLTQRVTRLIREAFSLGHCLRSRAEVTTAWLLAWSERRAWDAKHVDQSADNLSSWPLRLFSPQRGCLGAVGTDFLSAKVEVQLRCSVSESSEQDPERKEKCQKEKWIFSKTNGLLQFYYTVFQRKEKKSQL